MTSAIPEPRPNSGSYDLVREIGRGAVGTVYLARDQRIGRQAALKMIELKRNEFEDTEALEEYYQRLQREAEVSGALNHPNIVTLYEAGYEAGRISFLAMEYVDGHSLQDLIKERRPEPLPIEQTLSIARDVLSGLVCAHASGVIHRDIKPANILLTSDGRAKIADFGIARPQSSTITVEGTLIGTPNYMSPEQIRGEPLTPASDLFAFGVVLFEMLNGHKPFLGHDVAATLYNVVHGPTPPLGEETPPRVRELVETLLSKKPQYRFASTADALRELESILAERASEPTLKISGATPPAAQSSSAGTNESPVPRAEVTVTAGFWPRLKKQHVSRVVFASVIAVVAAPLLLVIAFAVPSLVSGPSSAIPPEKLREFREKAAMMASAEELCEKGELTKCIAAYDAYLTRYPDAPAAIEGRKRAQEELNAANGASKTPHRTSRWRSLKNRVKGLFGD